MKKNNKNSKMDYELSFFILLFFNLPIIIFFNGMFSAGQEYVPVFITSTILSIIFLSLFVYSIAKEGKEIEMLFLANSLNIIITFGPNLVIYTHLESSQYLANYYGLMYIIPFIYFCFFINKIILNFKK